MAQTVRLSAFQLSAGMSLSLCVNGSNTSSDLNFADQVDYRLGYVIEQDYDQGFAWFSTSVTFFPLGDSGIYWVEVLLANSYEVGANVDFAVLLPFTVTEDNAIQVGSVDGRDEICVVQGISQGSYQLIFQERYLTQPEIDAIPADLPPADPQSEPSGLSLGPKLCQLTFIPTITEVMPVLLKAPKARNIKLPLFLHRSQ
jgi:hypothetical protein